MNVWFEDFVEYNWMEVEGPRKGTALAGVIEEVLQRADVWFETWMRRRRSYPGEHLSGRQVFPIANVV